MRLHRPLFWVYRSMINPRRPVYDEVSGHQCLLKYMVSQAGGCKVLLHPKVADGLLPRYYFYHCSQQRSSGGFKSMADAHRRPEGAVGGGRPDADAFEDRAGFGAAAGAGEVLGPHPGCWRDVRRELRRLF